VCGHASFEPGGRGMAAACLDNWCSSVRFVDGVGSGGDSDDTASGD
jgi:hypothetical protein